MNGKSCLLRPQSVFAHHPNAQLALLALLGETTLTTKLNLSILSRGMYSEDDHIN